MTAFQYIAIDINGKRKKGVLEGDCSRAIRLQLREQQLTPLSVEMVSEKILSAKKPLFSLFERRSRKISTADLALITRQMATLLQAGLPIDEMLTAVSKQTEKQSVKEIVLGVRAKVLEGYTFADGLNDFQAAFPAIYRTTVAAGERGGKLGQILSQLADYTEKQHEIRQKIKQAMIYPIMMMSVSISIVTFLLIDVVPKIINVFNQTDQALPLATKILIAISDSVSSYGIYFIIFCLLFFWVWQRSLKHIVFQSKAHRVLLKLPVIGRAIRAINCARFGRTFGILNAASVPVLEAMNAALGLIKPLPMRDAISHAVMQIREGAPIHTALQKTGYFAPMFVHLVASGESSGQLDAMLEKAATYLEKDVEGLLQTAMTLFEPLMILVMGGVVLYIVLAIMLPIFALDNVS